MKTGNSFGSGLQGQQFQKRKFVHTSLYFVTLLACLLKSNFQSLAIAAEVISVSVLSPSMLTHFKIDSGKEMVGFQSLKFFSSSLFKPTVLLAKSSLSRWLPVLLLKHFCQSVLSHWDIANKFHDTYGLDILAFSMPLCSKLPYGRPFFFFFFPPQGDCNVLHFCTENGRNSAWVSCCSLLFFTTYSL